MGIKLKQKKNRYNWVKKFSFTEKLGHNWVTLRIRYSYSIVKPNQSLLLIDLTITYIWKPVMQSGITIIQLSHITLDAYMYDINL